MKMRYDYETMKKSRNYVKKSRSYLHIIFHNQISQFSNVAVYKFFCRISVNNIQCHTATSKYFWSHCFTTALSALWIGGAQLAITLGRAGWGLCEIARAAGADQAVQTAAEELS